MTQLPKLQCIECPLKFRIFRKEFDRERERGVLRFEGHQRATYILDASPYIVQVISRGKGTCGSVLTLLMAACSDRKAECPCSPSYSLLLFPDLLKKINREPLKPSLHLYSWNGLELHAVFPLQRFSLRRYWATPRWARLWVREPLFPISGPVPIIPYLCGHTHKTGRRCWGSEGGEVWVLRQIHARDSSSSLEKRSMLGSPRVLGQFRAFCHWKH